MPLLFSFHTKRENEVNTDPLIQAIEKIINFVTTTVHPRNIVNLCLSEAELNGLLSSASTETESIRKYLIAVLFNYHSQTEIEVVVQNYQSLIIRLLNDLFSYQESCKVSVQASTSF